MLLQLTRGADDLQRRVDMVRALTDLVVLMRQHVRKFLPDLLALVNDFWGASPAMLPHILSLLAELSRAPRGRRRWRGGLEGCAACYPAILAAPCLHLPHRSPPLPTPLCRPRPAETLRDDFRHHMPELLPKFVALLNEAERTSNFTLARGAWGWGAGGGAGEPVP